MKLPVTGIVITVLLGAASFGLYKSLELLGENARLSRSVSFLTSELEGTRSELKETKSKLSESSLVNSQLENDLAEIKGKFAKVQDKLSQYHQYTALLRGKYSRVLELAKTMDDQNRQMSEQLMRLTLVNQEMLFKLSSEKGLKDAIRDLRGQTRKRKVVGQRPRPVAPKKTTALTQVQPPASAPEPASGNQGFLVKDGRSTLESLVDIRVELTQ